VRHQLSGEVLVPPMPKDLRIQCLLRVELMHLPHRVDLPFTCRAQSLSGKLTVRIRVGLWHTR